jgi:hypothetical protein
MAGRQSARLSAETGDVVVNAHVGIDGLTALRRIDPDDAALGTALCALLRTAGMTVRLVATDGVMFATEGNVSFAVGLIDGQAPILSATRVAEAVAVLEATDPLLVEVEARLAFRSMRSVWKRARQTQSASTSPAMISA